MARRKAVEVRFDPTPNPNAGKFTVGRTLVEGRHGLTFDTAADAAAHPVAAGLLALDGVRSVFMVADFVTVTKDAGVRWADLAPLVQQAIRAAL